MEEITRTNRYPRAKGRVGEKWENVCEFGKDEGGQEHFLAWLGFYHEFHCIVSQISSLKSVKTETKANRIPEIIKTMEV